MQTAELLEAIDSFREKSSRLQNCYPSIVTLHILNEVK
jgi:hypothetical protein